jgi:uncharacterized protein YbbK (DUF523 family)
MASLLQAVWRCHLSQLVRKKRNDFVEMCPEQLLGIAIAR